MRRVCPQNALKFLPDVRAALLGPAGDEAADPAQEAFEAKLKALDEEIGIARAKRDASKVVQSLRGAFLCSDPLRGSLTFRRFATTYGLSIHTLCCVVAFMQASNGEIHPKTKYEADELAKLLLKKEEARD